MKNEIVLEENNSLDNFGEDPSGISESLVILVILTVFLGSRGAAEENYSPSKQFISETTQKVKMKDCFETEFRERTIFS